MARRGALTRVRSRHHGDRNRGGKTMQRKAMRTAVITSAVAATIVAGLAGATGAAAQQQKPALGPEKAPEGSPVAAAAKAYRTAFPQLSQADAELSARQQETRKSLHARITAGAGAKT